MNRYITILSFLITLSTLVVSATHNCSCYIYVGGYYGQQPYLLGNIENMTSCMNCTQEACQSNFVSVLDALEQYYKYAYPFYIYPYCPQPQPSTNTTVQSQVSAQVQENIQVSSNLPNVKVNVSAVTDVHVQENLQESYYPSNYYDYYPPDYYNYYYSSYYNPYGYYYYYYQPECCQGDGNQYHNVSKQLATMETQIQSIMQMLESLNQTNEIDGMATNLTILSNYVAMFEEITNSSLNSTQMLLTNIEMDMSNNFTKIYNDMMSLGKNLSKDNNYTKKELQEVLDELGQLNETSSCHNYTKSIDRIQKNISTLDMEYKELKGNMSSLRSQLATATGSSDPSVKAASSGSTSPTAIAGVVLGSIAVAGIVVVIVLVVMRIIV
ncbi:hypothetical protein GpartN1_g7520.t1 [Galdieria partita]|uniref:Uncharacterized protein n=1 Tax=Galdieria partita TaxID=83374 RepID=A0A9C7UTT6_9RHOD|nr:hypothetical protein GpartN1_g7520.t1 [Galdieria partita]